MRNNSVKWEVSLTRSAYTQFPFVSCRVWLSGLSFLQVCLFFFLFLLFYKTENLPVELSEEIFQNLGFRDIKNCARVSPKSNKIIYKKKPSPPWIRCPSRGHLVPKSFRPRWISAAKPWPEGLGLKIWVYLLGRGARGLLEFLVVSSILGKLNRIRGTGSITYVCKI